MDDWNKTPCQLESDMLINIGEKSSFRGSKRGRKGGKVGGGGEGKPHDSTQGPYQKKAERSKDGKASVVVVWLDAK